jgi:beta-glucanase (GH16 family)
MKLRQFIQSMRLLTASTLALALTTSVAYAATPLADFEGGLPTGWFTFFGGSTVTTATMTIADTDPLARPAQSGDIGILEAGFNVTDFGGFGTEFASNIGPQDWSGTEGFSFWFHGTNSGLVYQAEISDNRSDPNTDTSERFDYEFTDNFAGWRRIYIPWTDFTRATDFQPGGAPDDGFTLTEVWAWSIVLPMGADTVHFDDFTLVNRVVDDFEDFAPGSLPSGSDPDGVPVGYYTFSDGSPVAIAAQSTPPAPLSFDLGEPNGVAQVDLDVTGFAGFIHAFSNDTFDTWVPQDWSAYAGFSFWIYGNDSGTQMFIDLLDNRNPGSTSDDAERWTVTLTDDFSGWRYFEFPFAEFTRKEVGNGAPNDGLSLTEVHGWAFGTLGTGGPRTYYLDDAGLYGEAVIPELAVQFASGNYDIPEGATGDIVVKLNRAMNPDDPAVVSVDYATDESNATAGRDYSPTAGTLTFVNGGPSEQSFQLATFDNNKHTGDKRVILRLANAVHVTGAPAQATATIQDDETFDPLLVDDFESYPWLWWADANVLLEILEIEAGDPDALPGQGAFEGVLFATIPLGVDIDVQGRVCNEGNGVVPVVLLTTDSFDATTVDHTTVTLGDAYETHTVGNTGELKRHEEDADGDGDIDLVFHFQFDETGLECDPLSTPFNGLTYDGQPITADDEGASFGRDFALGQNWEPYDGLTFWYYGQNTGDVINVDLLDNRAPDPGPGGWNLVWSDEFDEPAGTPPDPANWGYELGDGALNGIPGWGNSELQYYTDSPANAATDGNGNLLITAREADGSLECYYGTCEYTSARLLTQNRSEFAYGRIEALILLPDGDAGLWPAFWSLGTDIGEVGWPQTGEIDFMEYVSRIPDEIFGTIHGPGYSGGASFGNIYPFSPANAYDEYHEFAVEWEPDVIRWYVDGIEYHTAVPADVAPNEWVFNDPIFMLLNQAIGGNFGGPVSEDLVFPQTLKIDYVRVYQGPDTAERWEASFTDDFEGWQQVFVPFASFTRNAEQPDGAPNDGLNLTEVWGYGFTLPDGGSASGYLLLDQVRLVAPTEVTVYNLNDAGLGSLRWAVNRVAAGGLVNFEPDLAGGTIDLTTGPLVIGKAVTIDGATAPGIAVSGGGADRVMIVDPGADVWANDLAFINGFGWQLAGGILNNGNLTLERVLVSGNTMATDAGDFWQGGGGIYNGEGASLMLVDSTVSDNMAGWSGGGVYSFFNTTTTIMRSTISGNVSNDVGGGLRLLGNAQIVNSTISGNESTGWYGQTASPTWSTRPWRITCHPPGRRRRFSSAPLPMRTPR